MEKIRLGVLFGGKSSEYEVSLSSAYAVLSHVDPEKYEVVRIGITKDGEFFKFDGDPGSIKDGSWCADTEKLDRIAVDPSYGDKRIYAVSPDGVRKEIVLDAVFPVLHGRFGEDGRLQGMLEVMGVPTVGCECTASAVTMDKALTKAVVSLFSDVRQAKAVTAFARDDRDAVIKEAEEKIGYPMFVKPSRSGSSVGCSAVKSREDLPAALGSAFSEDDKILIEERIKGKEIEVAVLEEDGELTVSSPAEIDVGSSDFYDYETKYVSDESSFFIPARIPDASVEEVRASAAQIFKILGCRGLSRVDFFLTKEGELIFNEINTMPGFTPISMYPKLMEYGGIPYGELIDRLIRSAMNK
ncbi:MAG: D-alanine--D-alanine ligase [Clostridia bacterium]|nr:D-alanine--D-alanine ligase [Clostridia bacterium]